MKEKTKKLVGSVKTNIGHTESAAGIAGIIKCLLMMDNNKIVPSLHIKKDLSNLNPEIKMDSFDLEIAVNTVPWATDTLGRRVCCVNSFGFGGSNSHAILVQQPKVHNAFQTNTNSLRLNKKQMVFLSAVDKLGLQKTVDLLHDELTDYTDSLENIAYTSGALRDHYQYRTCLQVQTKAELQEICGKATGDMPLSSRDVNIIFVYCGVGTTWTGMGSEMIKNNKIFRETIEKIDIYLEPLGKIKLVDTLSNDTMSYSDPFLSHISIFAVQVALTEVWKSFGVKPDQIVGQSVGEVAAAYASGVLDLQSATSVIYQRSKILAKCTGGSMMVVRGLNLELLENICKQYDNRVTIAVYISPVSCTLSGESIAMKKIKEDISMMSTKDGMIKMFELDVQCAYHSHLLEPCMAEIISTLHDLKANTIHTNIFSTVSGDPATGDDFKTGEYWAKNVRQSVRFSQALRAATNKDVKNVFIELGPKQVLKAHFRDIFEDQSFICLPSMGYKKEIGSIMSTICELYVAGVNPDFEAITGKHKRTSLPRYGYNRTKRLYLPEAETGKLKGISTSTQTSHMFIQRNNQDTSRYKLVIAKSTTPFVFDHYMNGALLVPGATYVEAVIQIACLCYKASPNDVQISIEFNNTITPNKEKAIVVDCAVTESPEGIHIIGQKNSKQQFFTSLASHRAIPDRYPIDMGELKSRCHVRSARNEIYNRLNEHGFKYGPYLSIIEESWVSNDECLVRFDVPENVLKDSTTTNMHPAIIDALFQMFGIFERDADGRTLPKGIGGLVINKNICKNMFGYAMKVSKTSDKNYYNCLLLTENGSVICEIQHFFTHRIQSEAEKPQISYTLSWKPINISNTNERQSQYRVLVFSSVNGYTFLENNCKELQLRFQDWKTLNGSKSEPKLFQQDDGSPFDAIVFAAVGKDIVNVQETILEQACARFVRLKHLLTILIHLRQQSPLFVVTDSTQSIGTANNQVNTQGSELWGMVRCAVQESVYPDVTLLDVDTSDFNSLSFCQIVNKQIERESEFVLKNGTIFVSRLEKRKDAQLNELTFRTLTVNNSDEVALKSSSNQLVNDLFFLHESKQKWTPIQKACDLKLSHVYLHNRAIFPCTQSTSARYSIWPLSQSNGFQVIALEGKGVVKQLGEKKECSYFLYPVDVALTVIVPSTLLFKAEHLPFYKPGMLVQSMLFYKLALEMPQKVNVDVVIETKHTLLNVLIQTFFKKVRRCEVRFLTPLEIEKHSDLEYLVICTETDVLDSHKLLTLSTSWKAIVVFPWSMKKHNLSQINISFGKSIAKYFETESAFSTENLLGTANNMMGILSQNETQQYIRSAIENDFTTGTIWATREIAIDTSILLRVREEHLFRKNCCYIVVGGLTGLGWVLVQIMVQCGAGYIVTISRRKPSVEKQDEINNLMRMKTCRIICQQTNINSLSTLSSTIDDLKQQLKDVPIKGIFHGAGVLADGLLMTMTADQLEKVLMPKIQGTWNLHLATQDLNLDYFVMHSSIVSVLGNAGQTNYGAGNSFLDNIAHYRRSRNMCGQSINWGALAVGMAKNNQQVENHLAKKGFSLLGVNDIRSSFLNALMCNDTQVTIGKFDWSAISQITDLAKLRSVANSRVMKSVSNVGTNEQYFDAKEYQQSDDSKKRVLLLELIRSVGSLTFAATEFSSIQQSSNLSTYGIDSMAALSFVNNILDVTGVKIAVHILLSDDTVVSDIVNYILKNIKTDNNSSPENPQTNESLENESDAISFMERSAIKEYLADRTYAGNTIIVEVEIFGLRQVASFWETVFKHVVKINPHLHRKFKQANDLITVEVFEDTDKHVQINNISVDEMSDIDTRHMHQFDISQDLPIRFQVASDKNHKRTLFRIIANFVFTDLRTLELLSSDIRDAVDCLLKDRQLPSQKIYTNASRAINEKLNSRFDISKLFWNKTCSVLECATTVTSLQETLKLGDCQTIREELSLDLSERILDTITEMSVTLFQYFASIYQIFLHLETKIHTVTVMSSVDMRIHVPELRDTPGRCINHFPLIGSFRSFESYQEFIQRNSMDIVEATENSLYPFYLIKEEMPNDSVIDNIDRHRIVMDNITEIKNVMKYEDLEIRMSKLWHSCTKETALYIEYDSSSKRIGYQFGFNKKVCGNEFGSKFNEKFKNLILASLNDNQSDVNSDIDISDIHIKGPDFQVTRKYREKTNIPRQNSIDTTTDVHQQFMSGNKLSNVQIVGDILKTGESFEKYSLKISLV